MTKGKVLHKLDELMKYNSYRRTYVIKEASMHNLAEEIVKLFAIPVVSICVCGTEEYAEVNRRADGLTYCANCNKPY